MESQNKKLAIFDFDGVLVNTLPFAFKLHKENNPTFTWEKYQKFGMGNFFDSMNKLVNGEMHIVPKDFDDKYKEQIEKINIVDTLSETIIFLSKDYILAVVSSTESNVIDKFLAKEKLRDYFSDILGLEIDKNKTKKISNLLQKYNILHDNAVLITDTAGDIKEADLCKVKSIGVTWGLHNREILEKGNPATIIDDPKELLEAIKNVLK